MGLRVLILLIGGLVAAGCCDRVACTDLPPSAYNNVNGGA